MKVLVIGGTGPLGRSIVEKLSRVNSKAVPVSRETGHDIFSNPSFLRSFVSQSFDACIFLAPVTRLQDFASKEEKDTMLSWATTFFKEIERVCSSRLLLMSSNHVFDGKRGPYLTSQVPDGSSWFAQSRLMLENIALNMFKSGLVVRTSMILDLTNSGGFLKWLSWSLQAGHIVPVRRDIIISPSLLEDIAQDVVLIIHSCVGREIFHLSNGISISKFKLAQQIAKMNNLNYRLIRPDDVDSDYKVSSGNYCLVSNFDGSVSKSTELIKDLLSLK